ncbi:MAG: DUF350 domain-containing protein [Myxococcota bacterium]
MNTDALVNSLVQALGFSLVGVVVFLVAFWLMTMVSPFSIKKEIEEDQNTALAILMASVILGLAWIVAAAIHG